jgi:hypothetical protein
MQVKRMNWFTKRPLHEQMEAWRERRREMAQQTLARSAIASTAFATAQISRVVGLSELAGQAAFARVQEELKAVAKELSVNKFV